MPSTQSMPTVPADRPGIRNVLSEISAQQCADADAAWRRYRDLVVAEELPAGGAAALEEAMQTLGLSDAEVAGHAAVVEHLVRARRAQADFDGRTFLSDIEQASARRRLSELLGTAARARAAYQYLFDPAEPTPHTPNGRDELRRRLDQLQRDRENVRERKPIFRSEQTGRDANGEKAWERNIVGYTDDGVADPDATAHRDRPKD